MHPRRLKTSSPYLGVEGRGWVKAPSPSQLLPSVEATSEIAAALDHVGQLSPRRQTLA